MGDYERIRLVTLGGPGVGKSAIVKRFLFNSYSDKYKPTVEELYNQEYDFGPMTLKVDILDTAGDVQFPAMRRLSIATAHAFLIVYAVDSRNSFDMVKCLFEEIREQRADFEDIPVVLTGNKSDIPLHKRDIHYYEVSEWIECNWPHLRAKAIECSAKEDLNVRDVFRTFLHLSKLPLHGDEEGTAAGLRRRSSAHAGSKAGTVTGPSSIPSGSKCPSITTTPPPSSTPSHSRQGTPTKGPPTSPSAFAHQQFLTEDSAFTRHKPRSRSLIRRSSKKAKQQVRDASGGPGDCQIN